MCRFRLENYLGNNPSSIRQLAKNIGVSRATIYRMMYSESDPHLSTLLAIANHFGCRIEDLIDEAAYQRGKVDEIQEN